MRSLRWLLLVTLILAAAAVATIYRAQRIAQQAFRRPTPSPVALDTKTMAKDWEWGQSGNGQPQVKIFAKNFKQSADSSQAELDEIELRIYQKDGLHYDRVRTAKAQFTTNDNKLYSPGEAEITLDVPLEGAPTHQLTSITASGINFDSKSGQAVTPGHVSFTFENGDGTCTGASYDPATHGLDLNTNVVVNLRGKGPHSKPMKVETAHLVWNETAQILVMVPWARMTRDQNVINAGNSTVKMKDGAIEWIDALQGHGSDVQSSQQIEYSADAIHVSYNDAGEMDKLTGTGNAKLISHGAASQTTLTGSTVELAFAGQNGESILTTANARGNGYLESKPVADPTGDTADTRILKADALDLKMKPGGKDLDRVTTQSPGTLEFVPSQAARRHRVLKAERMVIAYGPKNEIQSFHADSASTETSPSELERRKNANSPMAYTSSKTLEASSNEHGELARMKQSGDFRYSEGARKAQADSATLENDRNLMNLETHARISDESGATTGDQIALDQATGDFDARGHVATTRQPEQNRSESAMLDKDQPTQGTADRVTSGNRNHVIHYIGNAVVWQTSSRIQANRIDIDRDKKTVIADGRVVTQFQDKTQPTFTIVKSQHMVYTDQDRLANYTGGVDFWRPLLTVKSAALKAYLNDEDSDADSRLDHALGDGKVEIVDFAPDRQRVGNGEHAEYYTDEGKIILSGGVPQLNDSKRGNTRGEKLTYFTKDNRLLVDGAPEKKAQSHIRKKS